MEITPNYRLCYRLRQDGARRLAANGPWTDEAQAVKARDELFAMWQDVLACWIEKEGIPIGELRERTK